MITFRDALDLAVEFGARRPKFDHTAPVAQCWMDRIAWLRSCPLHKFPEAIEEANRYAG